MSRAYWEELAQHDPLWAVLSDPAKAGRRWDLTEFMRTGEREIALLCFQLDQLGLPPPSSPALDFGCGVGRLTQALAARVDAAIGIDVSARMVDLARRVNRRGKRVQYLQNDRPDLALIPSQSIGFIYSNITLQHVPPTDAVRYIQEFIRILRPGGFVVFQLPSHRRSTVDATTRPMADEAYLTSIALLQDAPTRAVSGAHLRLGLQIVNQSPHEWRQPEVGSLRVGNHWLDATAETMLIQDDAREVLPQVFAPGQRYLTDLTISAPPVAGAFVAEIDLVHEGVTWFGHKASPTLRFPVTVTLADGGTVEATPPRLLDERALQPYDVSTLAGLTADDQDWAPPADFPMDGIARDDVIALLTAAGGRVLHVEDDPRAGSEWQAYRYFVQRP